ncbi:hypothetical protein NUM3379_22200 [Kineococcus sp. NUM-3379]
MDADERVCFLGDSFVAGVGDPAHLGWAGRLAASASAAGRRLTAYNLGVRRDTSAQVLARWEAECVPRLPGGCAARVVVSFGVNDTTLEDGRPRVEPERSPLHLAALLDGAAARRWPVLVVGPPPVADTAQNGRTAVLDEAFGGVCATRGVPYVPVLGALLADAVWRSQVAADDGAHPAAEGYARLAALVRPVWETWPG